MRRILAASIGLLLALVGAFLVVTYASAADERAAAGMETQGVLVALEPIPVGTPVADFGDRVEVRQIPKSAVVGSPVKDLADVASLVLTTETVSGEQLTRSRFVTPDELRSRGEAELPEELANHHQVTVLLDKTRALGGNIAPGDTVGVFMSFQIDNQDGADGTPTAQEDSSDAGTQVVAGGGTVDVTDLTLHKVPVVRVEGAFVEPAVRAGDEKEATDGKAEDRIFVTLALEPEDAAKVVFASEWGAVWLSLEPEGASEDEVPPIVITVPTRGEGVL